MDIKSGIFDFFLDILKEIIIGTFKWLFIQPKEKKEKKKLIKVSFKKPFKIFKLLVFISTLENIISRILAKLNPHAENKDYSWILEYPLRKTMIDLNKYIDTIDKKSNVIDLGCGSGYFSIELAKHLKEGKVFAVDINMSVLKKLKSKINEEKINNIELHRANIENLPFDENFFDVAFLNMTYGQLEDKVKALLQINRVLKKGAYLYITELLIDKYYSLSENVISLVKTTGFEPVSYQGNFLNYTLIFRKK